MPSDTIEYYKVGDKIDSWEIEIEYVHNLKQFYKRMWEWFNDDGLKDMNGGDHYETRYWQHDMPNGLQEHHIWWRGFKNAGQAGAENSFFTWFIKFEYQTVAAKKAEIMHKGKKWKLAQSNTIIRCSVYLIKNFNSDWSKGVLKGFKRKFELWLYRDRIQQSEGDLLEYSTQIKNVVKNYLQLRGGESTPPHIHPPNSTP